MQKPEIIGGLKRAVERGYSLEQAKRSLLNAGYSIEDVDDSADAISGVIGRLPSPEYPILSNSSSLATLPPIPPKQPLVQPQFQQQTQVQPQIKPKKSVSGRKILIIFLIILFIALLGGLISLIIFKDSVIDFINNLSL
ncbi:hypothetical protein HYW76_01410 [Candidatus Pacearchaeota archaeon]|nr:hypothetical protein [Candidatus Pacearchaeota archaeon]